MNKINMISSLIRMDFYLLKPYKKSLLVLLALAAGMTVGFESTAMLSSYLMFSLIMVTMYPFSIGETNRIDTLYATLPLKRRSVVVGRYVFALCLEVITILLAIALSFVFSFFTSFEFVFKENLLVLCVMSFALSFMVSVQFPIYFKLGYNKAKMIAYLPMLLIFFVVMVGSNSLKSSGLDIDSANILRIFDTYTLLIFILPVIAGLVLLAVSCYISCRLYEKREL